jgi:hypothetical protein
MKLTAIALNCTLKGTPHRSSTDKLWGEIAEALKAFDITTEIMMMLTARASIMGKFKLPDALRILGWIATAVMALVVIALSVTVFQA